MHAHAHHVPATPLYSREECVACDFGPAEIRVPKIIALNDEISVADVHHKWSQKLIALFDRLKREKRDKRRQRKLRRKRKLAKRYR